MTKSIDLNFSSRRLKILYVVSSPVLDQAKRIEENMCTERGLCKLMASRLTQGTTFTELRVGDRFSPYQEYFIPGIERIREGLYDDVEFLCTFLGRTHQRDMREMIEEALEGAPTEIRFG